MVDVYELLLDKVKEKGIVKIILDYKYQMEHIKKKPKNSVYTSLDIIDSMMLDFHLNNFNKKRSKRNILKDSRLSSNNFRNRNN